MFLIEATEEKFKLKKIVAGIMTRLSWSRVKNCVAAQIACHLRGGPYPYPNSVGFMTRTPTHSLSRYHFGLTSLAKTSDEPPKSFSLFLYFNSFHARMRTYISTFKELLVL